MAYSITSELLYKGESIPGLSLNPEAIPLFETTAFTWKTLSEAKEAYSKISSAQDFTYIRTCNPNRQALAEVISYLENGEKSLICSSGMGAITSTLLTFLKPGDHVVYGSCCYGETLDVMQKLLTKFGVETTSVSFDNMADVESAVKPNTAIIYCEVAANPCMNLADIPACAELAHKNGAMLIVDNTFTTPLAIRPLDFGADIVINSMTKFINGHSDALVGSVTASAKLIDQITPVSMYCGTPGDPFASWMIMRGIHTIGLRVPKQMSNAAKLAAALEQDPHVTKVNHPSLESFPQHELATRLFKGDQMSAMMSIIVPEDLDKMDKFLGKLHFAHYVPSLGGVRTALQHPCTSSHGHTPDAERRKIGITPGMIRISVGIEDPEDLIADFTEALKAFD